MLLEAVIWAIAILVFLLVHASFVVAVATIGGLVVFIKAVILLVKFLLGYAGKPGE